MGSEDGKHFSRTTWNQFDAGAYRAGHQFAAARAVYGLRIEKCDDRPQLAWQTFRATYKVSRMCVGVAWVLLRHNLEAGTASSSKHLDKTKIPKRNNHVLHGFVAEKV